MTLPASALITTQGTCTGQKVGANRIDRVKTGAKHTILISEIISICILTVVFIFAKPIVTAFGLGLEGYRLLRCSCTVSDASPAFVCVLFSTIEFIPRCKQYSIFYLCSNGCLDSSCGNCLSFSRDFRRGLSHDLVKYTFWKI